MISSRIAAYCLIAKKVNKIKENKSFIEAGKMFFTEKKLKLGPFEPVLKEHWNDWEADPFKNVSWQWRLNWLSFLSFFIAYHSFSPQDSILDSGRDAIIAWQDTFLEETTPSSFRYLWHDHGTALRAEQVLFFIFYCRSVAPRWCAKNMQFLSRTDRFLITHGEKLAEESFYSRHTNHGIEQSRVLLLLGLLTEGMPGENWRSSATERLHNELMHAFTEEGVHKENSPAYHVFVFKIFIDIVREYPAEAIGPLASDFSKLANAALDFFVHILRPDSKMPILGDSELLNSTPVNSEYFENNLNYQYLLYTLCSGTCGTPPTVLNKVYPKSGYAIFRDKWPNAQNYEQAFHIIVKVGTLSRYHHQQDEGHISVYGLGEDWLIDSGLYNYMEKTPIRRHMRSRYAHNVPIITGAAYSVDFSHRMTNWSIIDWNTDDNKPYVHMHIGVLLPVIHKRQVSFDSQSSLLDIDDVITADDSKRRSVTFLWHTPRDKRITILQDRIEVRAQNGNTMHVQFSGDTPDHVSLSSGIKKDRVVSVVSYRVNSYEESQVIRVSFYDRQEINLKTRFSFTRSGKSAGVAHS